MMTLDRMYRISMFGDFGSISANPENMQYFFEYFKGKDMLPSVYQEVQLNVPTNNGKSPTLSSNIQRIMLLSTDGNTKFVIGSNRIDYELSITEDIKLSEEQLSNLHQNIAYAYSAIFERYRTNAFRLALNADSIIVELSPEAYDLFMSKYTNPISLYNNSPMDEWSTRLMVRKNQLFNNGSEDFNIITIIQKQVFTKNIDGVPKPTSGFGISIDINTVPENNIARFSATNLEEFFKISENWWNNIINEIGEK